MLEGITILNQTEITRHAYNFKLMGLFALLCIICLIVASELYVSRHEYLPFIFVILCLAFFVGLLHQIYSVEEIPTGRYKYEVTVDESVRFTDIYEKYEVVEQRGEIWVLEDKDE